MNFPLLLIERSGLLENGVRYRDLTHIMELGGLPDLLDLFVGEPEPLCDLRREFRDIMSMRAQVGAALERVRGRPLSAATLTSGRRASVQTVADQRYGIFNVGRLVGKNDRSVRTTDVKAFSTLPEGVDGALKRFGLTAREDISEGNRVRA